MSEHFNPFDEREEEESAETEQAPEVPEPPEQQTFFERVREILHLDDDEEDDDIEAVPRRQSIFRRFFARVPGVVTIQRPEEAPESEAVEAEAPVIEHGFALPFVEVASTVEDPVDSELVASPAPIIEEYTEIAIEAADSDTEPVVMYEVDELIITEDVPVESEAEQPIDIEPVMFGLETIAIGGPTEVAPPQPESPDETPAVSRREAKKIAKKATHDANKKATTQAKKREQKVADESKKRDRVLARKIEALKQDNQTLEEQLRDRLRSEQAIVPDVVAAVEQAPMPPKVEAIEAPAPAFAAVSPERPSRDTNRTEVRPERELVTPYTPERHDKIPPSQAFEQLTGMEVPLPRTLEQERRFEVKDEASAVPAAYTQVNPVQPPAITPIVAPQATRSALVGLGPSTDNPHAPNPAQSPDQTYKQAVVSGLVTAVVLLAIMIAWSFFF